MQGDFHVEGYEIEGLLGAGPSGEVWLARENSSGNQVALKRLRPRDTDAQAQARRIVSVLGTLGHPHLLTVREMLPYGDEVVLVLDYAAGGSLGQLLLARGTLDPGEVVSTVSTVATALAAAHERGLVHGDVTPENILFTGDGRPLLADLGLLALVEGGELSGTHGYVDPAGQDGGPAPAGDVYALAAVCYTALTGAPPEPGHGRRPLHQVAPGVPPGLSHAIEAGLQPDPRQRPGATEFGAQLDASCARVPVRFPDGMMLGESSPPSAPPSPHPSGPSSQPPPTEGAVGDGDSFVLGAGAPLPPGAGAPPASTPGPPAQPSTPITGFPVGPPAVQYADDEESDEDAGEDSARGPRPLLIGLAVGVPLLVIIVVLGSIFVWRAVSGGPEPTPEPVPAKSAEPTAEPSPDSTVTGNAEAQRWAQVLDQLDRLREEAWAAGQLDLLGKVYAPGSPALQADQSQMTEQLHGKGFTKALGFRSTVSAVDVVSQNADKVVLEVVSQLQEYTVVSQDSQEFQVPGAVPKRFTITLVPDARDGWVISDSRQAS